MNKSGNIDIPPRKEKMEASRPKKSNIVPMIVRIARIIGITFNNPISSLYSLLSTDFSTFLILRFSAFSHSKSRRKRFWLMLNPVQKFSN